MYALFLVIVVFVIYYKHHRKIRVILFVYWESLWYRIMPTKIVLKWISLQKNHVGLPSLQWFSKCVLKSHLSFYQFAIQKAKISAMTSTWNIYQAPERSCVTTMTIYKMVCTKIRTEDHVKPAKDASQTSVMAWSKSWRS